MTTEVKFVVCLDSLGQDREFSEDQRRFVLNTIKRYIQFWEDSEKRALDRDCLKKINMVRRDPTEGAENFIRINDEVEKQIEDHSQQNQESYVDEEHKELELTNLRLHL
jgi:hypothetical protein